MHPRILLPFAILCLLIAIPVFGAETVESTDALVQEMRDRVAQPPCVQADLTKNNKCFSDTIRWYNNFLRRYVTADRTEHKAWHDLHDVEGLTDAYRTAHDALHATMAEKNLTIRKLYDELRKKEANAQRSALEEGAGQKGGEGYTKPLQGSSVQDVLAACQAKADRTVRACMRAQLKLINPSALKKRVPAAGVLAK